MQERQRYIDVQVGSGHVTMDVTDSTDTDVEKILYFVNTLLTNMGIPKFKISDIKEKF